MISLRSVQNEWDMWEYQNWDDLIHISPKMSKISQNWEYQNWDDLTEICPKMSKITQNAEYLCYVSDWTSHGLSYVLTGSVDFNTGIYMPWREPNTESQRSV